MRNWGKNKDDASEGIPPTEWYSYFSNILCTEKKRKAEELNMLKEEEIQPAFTELSYRITDIELNEALKKLNQNASSGHDKVSAKFLFAGGNPLLPVLSLFLNKTFSEVSHPSAWALNYLKSIHKKGSVLDPDNYR